jgi:hypothetical protein
MSTTTEAPGYSFDVGVALFGTPSTQPLPTAVPGEIIVCVPAGISPRSLRDSDVGKQLIHQQVTWYDACPWANEPVAPGVYHSRLPVPNSNHKTFDEQQILLFDGEGIIALALAELALLCIHADGQPDPLQHDWVRCREGRSDGHAVLRWGNGRLVVDFWRTGLPGYRHLWLGAAKKMS